MAKLLYLIASHKNPEQVIRLVKTLRAGSPGAQIIIHHDYSKSNLDTALLKFMSNVHVMEDYVPVQWGEFSMVQMELHCINWLINNSIEFDWLIMLSGQDYPIQSLSEVEQFLENTQYDGFMDYFLAKTSRQNSTEENLRSRFWRRYFYQYYRLSSSELKIANLIGRLINKRQPYINLQTNRSGTYLGIRCFSTPFTSSFHCYTGSNWHTLSYRCIQYIHEFVRQNPAFVKHYQKTLTPDESFFQTILLNHSQLNIFNGNERYISWDRGTPSILGIQDLENLITSDRHFARKFDIKVDTQVLDLLDQYILRPKNKSSLLG